MTPSSLNGFLEASYPVCGDSYVFLEMQNSSGHRNLLELWHYIMCSVLLSLCFLGVGWLVGVGFFDRQWEKRHLRCPQYRFLCLFAALSVFLHIANRPGQSHLHIWRCSHRGSTNQIPKRIAFLEFNHLECNPSSLWPLSPDVPLKALQRLTPVLDLCVSAHKCVQQF